MTASIALQTVLLSQSAPVELWDLDLQTLGGPVYRFSNFTNELGQAVVWQGNTYNPLPIQASGFDRRSSGPFPRPRVQCSNVYGVLGSLIRTYDNLRGAQLLRRRTLARFLDAANFAAGNPDADPLAEYTPEVWMVDQCTGRNRLQVQWQLRNPLDFDGVMLPARVVHANYCPWQYRSSDCGYTGGPVAKVDDSATAVPEEDRCSKRLSGCKLRFPNQALPFGGFPGVGRLRSV
jgi:lambda family phage minor tail protein L